MWLFSGNIQENSLDRISEERSCSENDILRNIWRCIRRGVTDELFEDIVETDENEMIHLSRRDISLMLVGLSYRHSMSKEAIADIIKLIDVLLGKTYNIEKHLR